MNFSKLSKETWLGSIISLLISVAAIYVWFEKNMWGRTGNEIGDFCAGFGSLLAFIWLVVAYTRQGQELKQNTEALQLQAQELAQSVKAQQQLAQTAADELRALKDDFERRTLKDETRATPIFEAAADRDEANNQYLIINNIGGPIQNVHFRGRLPTGRHFVTQALALTLSKPLEIKLDKELFPSLPYEIDFIVSFTNELGDSISLNLLVACDLYGDCLISTHC